jgi:DNA-directed RNA polymerase specialized sigma24 family protein
MSSVKKSESNALRDALATMNAACTEATAAVDAIADPNVAFQAATDLAGALREAAESAADLRARTVVRILEIEEISLAELGRRLGLSKGRVDQLVRAGKRADTPSDVKRRQPVAGSGGKPRR